MTSATANVCPTSVKQICLISSDVISKRVSILGLLGSYTEST